MSKHVTSIPVAIFDFRSRDIQPCKWPGPDFCLLLRVSSDCAQPITGQVTEVTCPAIGRAQPELTPSKRQKTGPEIQDDGRNWRHKSKMAAIHIIHIMAKSLRLTTYWDNDATIIVLLKQSWWIWEISTWLLYSVLWDVITYTGPS